MGAANILDKKRKQVTLYLNPNLAKRLKLKSVETGKEMSEITEDALTLLLDIIEEKGTKR